MLSQNHRVASGMSASPMKRQIWAKVGVHQKQTYLELYETKPIETLSFCLFVYLPVLSLSLAGLISMASLSISIDLPVVVSISIISLIPGLAILILYRPARRLRLFPKERVACVTLRYALIPLPSRWIDLGQGNLLVVSTGYSVEVSEMTIGEVFTVLALMLLGPIGLLITVLSRSSRDGSKLRIVYALGTGLSYQPPLAFVTNKAAVDQLVAMYHHGHNF